MNLFPTTAKETILSSLIATILSLFLKDGGGPLPIFLVVYTPIITVLNNSFLKKERSGSSIAIFNLIVIILFEVAIILLRTTVSLFISVLFIPLFVLISAFSVRALTKETGEKSILRLFDISIFSLIFTIFYLLSNNANRITIVYPIIATTISLITILTMRQGGKKKGWILTVCVALVTLFLVFLLDRYAPTIGKGLVNFWYKIVALAKRIYAFFLYLISLLPSIKPKLNYDILPKPADGEYRREVVTGTIGESVLKIIVFAFFLIVAIIALIIVLKNIKRNGGAKTNKKKTISNNSLIGAIKASLLRLKDEIKLRRYIRQNKDYSLGLSLWMEKKLKNDIWHRELDESRTSFVERIGLLINEEALIKCSKNVDEILYSNEKISVLKVEESKSIRNRILKAKSKRDKEKFLERFRKHK
mgnify:CR=1 FL=1